MSIWKDDLEAQIAKIHSEGGVTNDQVTADVNAAVADAVKPQQDAIVEIQATLNDIVAHLQNGDAVAALPLAVAAAETVAAVAPPADAGASAEAGADAGTANDAGSAS